jgi:hypothetical protein
MRFVPVRFVVVIVGLTTRTVVAPDVVPEMLGVIFSPIKDEVPEAGANANA